MSTLIVIVNYRTPALVIDCLRSLESEIRLNDAASVVVVDNDSSDQSVAHITTAVNEFGWSHWVRVVESPINGGFAYGNNLAIREARASQDPPRYVWLLNPDTLVREGALRILVEFMDSHLDVGIVGSAIEEDDEPPWPYAFRFPNLLSELERGLNLGIATRLLGRWAVIQRMPESPGRVDWVSGASMLMRSRMFEDVGPMDQHYFLYFEETDYCLQARRKGWQTWYVPASRVIHIAGQSTGVTSVRLSQPRRLPAYWFESRRRYFVKNHGRLYAAATDATWIVSYLIWRMRRFLQRKPDFDPPHQLADFLTHSALFNSGVPTSTGAKRAAG